jgi:hypothetical protein
VTHFVFRIVAAVARIGAPVNRSIGRDLEVRITGLAIVILDGDQIARTIRLRLKPPNLSRRRGRTRRSTPSGRGCRQRGRDAPLTHGAKSITSEPKGQELVYPAHVSLEHTQMPIEDNLVNLSPARP